MEVPWQHIAIFVMATYKVFKIYKGKLMTALITLTKLNSKLGQNNLDLWAHAGPKHYELLRCCMKWNLNHLLSCNEINLSNQLSYYTCSTINKWLLKILYDNTREKYTGAPGNFATDMQKKEPSKIKKRASENRHRLQCKSLFNVADLVNGMWKVAPKILFFCFFFGLDNTHAHSLLHVFELTGPNSEWGGGGGGKIY